MTTLPVRDLYIFYFLLGPDGVRQQILLTVLVLGHLDQRLAAAAAAAAACRQILFEMGGLFPGSSLVLLEGGIFAAIFGGYCRAAQESGQLLLLLP